MPARSSSSQVAADPLACTALFFFLACLQTVAHFVEVSSSSAGIRGIEMEEDHPTSRAGALS